MKDQAYNLRQLINSFKENNEKLTIRNSNKGKEDARVITVTSGKGGVGKTNFTINLGIALSNLNKKVTIIDADLGLSNIDVVLGLIPKYTLANVVRGEVNILDIGIKGPSGINIISGGSGIVDLIDLSQDQINNLIKNFLLLNDISDYILIDTGAGLNNSVLSFIEAANEMIIIITPEPTSITDAYAVIKNISNNKRIKLVINRVESSKEGYDVFNKINSATKKFLNIELENLGFIFEDSTVKKSVKEQKPFLIYYPNSIASKGIDLVAYNLLNNSSHIESYSTFKKFINKLFFKL
ncbi:MAG: flagellar biosynthesis protein FlhG [Candidatus Petromonas sp.]|jgi:flagellar biosynthesis protein FlhG|nr:flagellar biosynthesis protein FlhG [Candidatus Petromonas sp.]